MQSETSVPDQSTSLVLFLYRDYFDENKARIGELMQKWTVIAVDERNMWN